MTIVSQQVFELFTMIAAESLRRRTPTTLNKAVESVSASFWPSKSFTGFLSAWFHQVQRAAGGEHTICPSATSRTWSRSCSAMIRCQVCNVEGKYIEFNPKRNLGCHPIRNATQCQRLFYSYIVIVRYWTQLDELRCDGRGLSKSRRVGGWVENRPTGLGRSLSLSAD